MRTLRVIVGIGIWLGLAGGAWWLVGERFSASGVVDQSSESGGVQGLPPAQQLWRYATAQRREAPFEMERPATLAVGDPIFVVDGQGDAVQVGEVLRVADAKGAGQRWTTAAAGQALFYPQAPPLAPGARLEYYATPQSLDWVVQTMLPPAKRRLIAQELSVAFQQHQEEVLQALRPVVEESLRDALAVIEQDLPAVVRSHRPQLEKLGDKYRGPLLEQRLAPLVRKEIWPLVQRRAEPLANEIGQEVWERASLWRFGWRLAYDVSPLPERNLAEHEWRRFLKDEATPVLEAHTDDFIRLQQQILADVVRNEKVRKVVRQSVIDITNDPEVQHVAWTIFRDALLQNPRLQETLERHWRSEAAQRAFALAAERFEPTVRRIGDLLFGTRETGVSPEFAQVLRNQILGKDRRWLVLKTPAISSSSAATEANRDPAPLRVRIGRDNPRNPFVPHSLASLAEP